MTAAKLTEQLLTSVCDKVRSGVPFKIALASEGITNDMTPWRWKQRGKERPGSIYGRWVDEIARAEAEASVIDVLVVRNAATRTSTTVTRKLEQAVDADGNRVFNADGSARLIEIERTEVVKPPDPKWSAWLLEHRDGPFRPQQDMNVEMRLPKDVMARSIAERLRILKGGDPNEGSLLDADDQKFAALMSPGSNGQA